MMIGGAIELASQIRLSFAVWRLLDYGRTSEVMILPTVLPWVWLRSCFFSGGNQPGDAGGREWSLTMWME